jgi:glycosyltransferase involved in cell wall biosynthesis
MTAAVALMLQFHRTRGTWSDSVDGYLALSEFARQKFIESGLPAKKIYVKPNFVCHDPGLKVQPGKYALFVGRLSPEKGIENLISAWGKMKISVPLVIVGDGPLRKSMESEVASQYLPAVTFRGWLTREETLAAMKQAAFMVTPSVWYEGFPMSIAEAFACGTPVLCSRLGSMCEIVQDKRTGLHFNSSNPEDLASKVEWAWSQPDRMAEMGRAARKEYEARYTAARNYDTLMQIYEQTMRACARN